MWTVSTQQNLAPEVWDLVRCETTTGGFQMSTTECGLRSIIDWFIGELSDCTSTVVSYRRRSICLENSFSGRKRTQPTKTPTDTTAIHGFWTKSRMILGPLKATLFIQWAKPTERTATCTTRKKQFGAALELIPPTYHNQKAALCVTWFYIRILLNYA